MQDLGALGALEAVAASIRIGGMDVSSLLGWAGMALYTLAFVAVASGLLPRSPRYFLANLVAACAVAISSAALASWQAVAVNVAWALLSANALAGRRIVLPIWVPHVVHLAVAGLVAATLWQLGARGGPAAVEMLAWFSLLGFVYSYLAFANFLMGPTAFHVWNFAAATSLIPQVLREGNYPVLAIEVLWASVAIYGLVREMRPGRVPA